MYPIHYILDDSKPVVLALDPVDSFLLAKMMANIIEVAVEKDLLLSFCLHDHFPPLTLPWSHIVQFALLKKEKRT